MEAARSEIDPAKRLELYRQVAPHPRRRSAGRLPVGRGPVLGDLQARRRRRDLARSASSTSCPGRSAGAPRPPASGRSPELSPPLAGVLVLDLSRVLAGPFCTMMLGDLGARVIKVEHPEDGDVTRGWGPPYHAASGLSAYYLSVNRNKESIALDLATPAGAESVRRLAGARRRARRELSAGRAREVRALARRRCARRTRGSSRRRSRVRPHRARRVGAGLRPARAGRGGPHGDHGRGRRRADEGRRRGLGPARGLLRRDRDPRRARGRASGRARARTSRRTSSPRRSPRSSTSRSPRSLTGEEARAPRQRASADRSVPDLRRLRRRLRPRRRAPTGSSSASPRSSAGPSGRRTARTRRNDARVRDRAALERELAAIFAREHARTPGSRAAARRASRPGRCAGRSRRCARRRRGPSEQRARGAGRRVRRVADPRRRAQSPASRFPPALDADGERLRREFDLPE